MIAAREPGIQCDDGKDRKQEWQKAVFEKIRFSMLLAADAGQISEGVADGDREQQAAHNGKDLLHQAVGLHDHAIVVL